MEGEMTAVETTRLGELEKKFEIVQKSFVEGGLILAEIRESRLYREVSDTFEGYCQVRWGFTRRRANQLIDAVAVVSRIDFAISQESERVPVVPISENNGNRTANREKINERVARELGKSPPHEQVAIYKEAVETAPKDTNGKPKVTAKHVERVAAKRKESEPNNGQAEKLPPWAEFETGVREVISDLRSASRKLGTVLGYDASTKRLQEKYAHFYSHDGTVGAVNAIVRGLEDNLPAAPSERAPGFIPARVVKSRESYSKSA